MARLRACLQPAWLLHLVGRPNSALITSAGTVRRTMGSVTTKAVTPNRPASLYNPWPKNPNPAWVLPRGVSIAWPGDVLAAGRPHRQSLFLTRGAPASGKTTFARALVDALALGTAIRVNKDDLRAMLHNGVYGGYTTEKQVDTARDGVVIDALNAGSHVVVDDTNASDRQMRHLAKLGRDAGVDVVVVDFTDVPLEVCLVWNATRTNPVPEEAIRNVTASLRAAPSPPHPAPAIWPKRPLVGKQTRATSIRRTKALGPAPAHVPYGRRVVLVDIDGTVALSGGRDPSDWDTVGADTTNAPVLAIVTALAAAGNKVVFLTERDEVCRPETSKWLRKHIPIAFAGPFMRPAGDTRKDVVVKAELYRKHVAGRHNVVAVLDDSKQMVDLWRSLGLTCLQVAEGNF